MEVYTGSHMKNILRKGASRAQFNIQIQNKNYSFFAAQERGFVNYRVCVYIG